VPPAAAYTRRTSAHDHAAAAVGASQTERIGIARQFDGLGGLSPRPRRWRASPANEPNENCFPEHLSRERVVINPPTACECCGGTRLRKLGEDVTT
jgi:hypothetical protein